ncbi:MAG: N-acetyl-alpha-D-glucosaminyl L-malate synthase BshA [Myxococcota bacterium]
MSRRIGILCYPTFGGSGIIATEIGVQLAQRGHTVHFVSTDVPRRLGSDLDNVFFHQVTAANYPVFPHVPYTLALASMLSSVAIHHGLDLIHAHYALPHAAAAWMAREALRSGNGSRSASAGLKIVTTLHGTDVTLIGQDDAYRPIIRHSLLQCDAVTTPSVSLRDDTHASLGLTPEQRPIEVIPNFVDGDVYRPREDDDRPRLCALFGEGRPPVIVHVSNFRPVKQVGQLVEVFAKVLARTDARLLLIGDGPERRPVEARLRELGLWDRARFIGSQSHPETLVRESAVFVLPSRTESFGLAALEAQACGVPVVAYDVGGLPEVVIDGETGFLVPLDDVDAMADRVVTVLSDPDRQKRLGAAARARALDAFRLDARVGEYEALYERVLTPRSR